MKKYFKSLLAIIVAFTALSFSHKTLAETTYIEGTRCPNPPSRDFISICGFVKSAVAITESDNGEEVTRALTPVKDVSVYLYECNNSSPTCKNNGNLVHPFTSTWTNEYGRFHLIARKVDSTVLLKSRDLSAIEDAVVPSKRRYLVFACGYRFAGLQAIPSFQNLPEIIQEVKCTDKDFSYIPPPFLYKFLNDNQTLAAQMGLEDDITTPTSDNTLTTQAVYENENNAPKVDMDINLDLEGADPRFTPLSGSDYIIEADVALGHSPNPEQGAFWSLDCTIKYAGDPEINSKCMQNIESSRDVNSVIQRLGLSTKDGELYLTNDKGEAWGDSIMSINDLENLLKGADSEVKSNIRDIQILLYELHLYYDPDFLIQNKLPNIPPRNAILFYKEFPARQDLTQYIQDPTDIARFLSSQFSNCIGEVFLRHADEIKESSYPSCEEFKQCSTTITLDGKNSYTTGGPAMWLSSPTESTKAYESADLTSPICNHNGNTITLKDIQPSWDLGPSTDYVLDKSYWNPEFLYYFGQNNVSAKYGNKFYSANDSFTAKSTPGNIDDEAFRAFAEGIGIKIQSGTSAIIPNDKKRSNNSVAAAVSILPQTNFFSSPTKSKDPSYKESILTNYTISSLGGQARDTSLYSNVNTRSEIAVTNPTQDLQFRNNSWFKGELHHYPWEDLISPEGGLSIWDTLANLIDVFKVGTPTSEAVAGYYTSMGYKKIGGKLYLYDSTTRTLEEWGTLEEFTKEYKNDIIRYQLGIEDDEINVQDGTRTATSALFFTSAAFRRTLALSFYMKGTEKNYGNDFIDSLYSAMIGNGVLAPRYSIGADVLNNLKDIYIELRNTSTEQLEQQIAESTFDAIRRLIDEVIKNGIAENEGKTFFDRQNFDKYGIPGYIDDLKATFGLSEETFIKDKEHPDGAFSLPNKEGPFDGDTVYWLDIEDWGEHVCYPWNKKNVGQSCSTSKEESVDEVSRTCRVDWCRKAEIKLTWECEKGTDIGGGVVIPDRDYKGHEVIINETPDWQCSRLPSEGRLTCAQKQISCLDENGGISGGGDEMSTVECMEEIAYKEDIENAQKPENAPSCPTEKTAYAWPHTIVRISKTLYTPACTVSAAGPYVCNGNLEKFSTLTIEQEALKPSEDVATVDDIEISDNELRMSLQSPQENIYNENFTAVSLGIYSADSSIKPEDMSRNISTGKDSYGLGASNINSGYVRGLFAAPTDKSPTPTYNAYSVHCGNTEIGGAGGWECETVKTPDPEISDTESLKIDQSCALNMSDKCKSLVFAATIANSESKPDTKTSPGDTEFSDTFYRIVSAAGTKFNVPASVLLTYMAGIGKLNQYEYYWSESGEKKLLLASTPWFGTLPKCDDTAIGAVGPYDWLLYWFNFSLKNAKGITEALDKIAENRSMTASRCNFLDATYTAAATLSSQGGASSCGGWNLSNSVIPLEYMTFGYNPSGVYAQDKRYFQDQTLKDIFTYCRN